MNKLEAIKRVEQMGEYERFVDEPISKLSAFNILNQLDEPEKIKIPQFVAEWIEKSKSKGWDLLDSMCLTLTAKNKETTKWLHLGENKKIFVRAWLDGYEVDKEPKYTVKIKATKHYFAKDGNGRIYFSLKYESAFTKIELEKVNLGWVFNCEGIEIEEVTE